VKLYIDTSAYNRPFDDQTQPRIWLETLALGLILQLVESGEATLVNSSVLEFENSRNPFPLRREWMERCLSLATEYERIDEAVRDRAQEYEKQGIAAIDALHVATAETANVDFFIACDDRLLKKGKHFKVKSLNPVDFVQQELGEQP
jgi:predicted nucleic acid-binding protein